MNSPADGLADLERAAGFGQWWHDPLTGQTQLSPVACDYLELPGAAEVPDNLYACFGHVVEEDLPGLMQLWTTPQALAPLDIRVIGLARGMRWLRVTPLPPDPLRPRWRRGLLQDVTDLTHAAVRERLGYALTEYLVGTHTLQDAITNVIQLICRNLGWEWGAYWRMEDAGGAPGQLHCRHFWHPPDRDLEQFSVVSAGLGMAPGEGLVGRVWATGQAEWVEDMSTDARFLRRGSAQMCGLWSGYVFPVTYVSDDGSQHCPGVLEFYSSLARQPDAQLPKVSATIGALIAQTAQRLETEAVIRRLAQVDEMTELDNRGYFYAQLNQHCALSQRQGRRFALMFIDLDRFKPINDAFGHEAGNAVLQGFARRLQALAPPPARVGRLGGDEFAVLVPDSGDEQALAALVDAVLAAASRPFLYENVSLNVSASIGVSRFPENGVTGPELLRSADAAMYRVKQNGRNGSTVFSTSSPDTLAQQRAKLAQHLAIETALHEALHTGQLYLLYQPIVDIASGALHGVEALIRWHRPDGETVPPDVFIPIAEQSHLIIDIGRWVLGQALRDLALLQRSGLAALKIHVNMAASEFTSSALPQMLRTMSAELAVPPSQVVLELTESMLMRQPEQVKRVMHQLRDIGFEISLDDFGMGHSSLAMLKSLPIRSLKIDRSFVRDLPTGERDRAIAQTIVHLGQHLQLEVIAEGIESAEQLAVLADCGCRFGQGWLLGRPLPLQGLIAAFPNGRPR
ncbi:GGDEF domain-containing protein [Pelomonas sp. UHG3]|uniref:GGDEF domain-containing protein n=1 Tax=Roseateles hydrophilus TaxID=2975054 RepID=A0ACC6CDY6_9BURK|nr:GGDEF domain-containing protein [Pelomonas sp. UHG3]MCY4746656.1 GGDEF domain-containing protein [Pelomonas sp. UHG3]